MGFSEASTIAKSALGRASTKLMCFIQTREDWPETSYWMGFNGPLVALDAEIAEYEYGKNLIQKLMNIHYGVFMSSKRFWYEPILQEADKELCVAASDIRKLYADKKSGRGECAK